MHICSTRGRWVKILHGMWKQSLGNDTYSTWRLLFVCMKKFAVHVIWYLRYQLNVEFVDCFRNIESLNITTKHTMLSLTDDKIDIYTVLAICQFLYDVMIISLLYENWTVYMDMDFCILSDTECKSHLMLYLCDHLTWLISINEKFFTCFPFILYRIFQGVASLQYDSNLELYG